MDDHPVVQQGIAAILHECEDFEVVAMGSTGQEALSLCQSLHPDILLLDIALPDISGLDLVRTLERKTTGLKIVFISMWINQDMVSKFQALKNLSFISKTEAITQYPVCLRKIIQGAQYVSKDVDAILRNLPNNSQAIKEASQLTLREKQILRMVVDGHTSRNIGQLLNIKKTTVDWHRSNLMKKLQVNDKAELIELVSTLKLFPPKD